MNKLLILSSIFFFAGCTNNIPEKKSYSAQIGDTVFNSDLDSPTFTFCDAENILHKRAYIRYKGGWDALNNELLSKYEYNSSYEEFTGYFIIRFAVNCLDQTGRFRMQIVDSNFKQIESPKALEADILAIAKALNGWTHPNYKGEDYDGYTFLTLRIINGQLIEL